MIRTYTLLTAFSVVALGCDSSGVVTRPKSLPSSPPAIKEHLKPFLTQIVVNQFELKPVEFDENKPFSKLGDKSNWEFNVSEVILHIEKTYGVTIPNERFRDRNAGGFAGVHKDLTPAKLLEVTHDVISALGQSKRTLGAEKAKQYIDISIENQRELARLEADLVKLKSALADVHTYAANSTKPFLLVKVLRGRYELPHLASGQKFKRVLILQKEFDESKDYWFMLLGREYENDGRIITYHGKSFWIDKKGQVDFKSGIRPPGQYLVLEHYVPAQVEAVSLVWDGVPVLKFKLR